MNHTVKAAIGTWLNEAPPEREPVTRRPAAPEASPERRDHCDRKDRAIRAMRLAR